MNPSRGVRWSALLAIVALATSSSPARSLTVFDDPSPFMDGPEDAFARSPRLLGMGRLGFVLEDAHRRINIWDLGRNPVGVLDADSSSTLEFSPTTGSASTTTDRFGPSPAIGRQTYAERDFRTYYEAWRRSDNSTYGLAGDFSAARTDRPINEDVERRSEVGRPNVMPILAARIPYVPSGRLSYALRAVIATPTNTDHYRLLVRNSAGEFIDKDGTQVTAPDFFAPNESQVRSVGIGAHLGFAASRALHLAAGYDFVNHKLVGENVGFRHASEVHEERPYHVGQVTAAGWLGNGIEWGVDARAWRSRSDQTWAFTTSAGSSVAPLTGRGKLLDRKEEGSALRGRARWKLGALEVGAGISTAFRELETTPPEGNDVSSLNRFLNVVFHRQGADTLVMPDSLVHNIVEDRSWEGGGGVAWSSERTTLGFEGHVFQAQVGQEIVGLGPKRVGWDVRAGMERRVFAPLWLRAGYLYRWEDRDDFTVQNEFRTSEATAGFGYRPGAVRWAFDAGYSYQWVLTDFSDPNDSLTSRQRLAARLRWVF